MRHAVILAGGSGTRLWPASRRARPKQFAPFGPDGTTLLEAAIRRAARIAGRITIVTAQAQVEVTRTVVAVLRDVGAVIDIVGEPVGRNTAAAIGLAAALVDRDDPGATLAILPADQRIANETAFAAAATAVLSVVERDDAIGTLGIVPTRAETGFGYLEAPGARANASVTPVVRFVEKPDQSTAERYVAGGDHLWNAGIFFATARRILAELAARVPDTARAVVDIAAGTVRADDAYPSLPSISIDHAVMEHADGVVTIAADIGWDDVGSWEAIAQLAGDDKPGATLDPRGNVIVPEHCGLCVDVPGHPAERNLMMSTDGTLIVACGVSDLVIVKAGNAVLVIPRAEAQRVRDVVEALEQRGLAKYL